VNGFALGGGCELAMACDMIFAGDKAKFGQPEIKLGTIPGCGGTQRLTAAVGKYRAMDLVLTGDMLGADEALRCGLVSRVVPAANLVETALAAGETIAGYSQPIVAIAKEAVKKSQDLPLTEGITYERRMFWSTFATEDQKEGMDAFATKREAKFTNK
jgi:enoyl-CoA hydratase/carnithine racemase